MKEELRRIVEKGRRPLGTYFPASDSFVESFPGSASGSPSAFAPGGGLFERAREAASSIPGTSAVYLEQEAVGYQVYFWLHPPGGVAFLT